MFPIRSLPHLRHCIRQFHASRLIKSVVTENVPALGESITEGTISKWMKNIADKIAVDDVVVVVETDKVTVDIKATVSGVLSEQLVSASENVAVGMPLFKIDTTGSTSAATKKSTSKPSSPPAKTAPSDEEEPAAKSHIPLIKFIGKRSLLSQQEAPSQKVQAPISPTQKLSSPPAKSQKPVKQGNGVDFATLKGGAWYGRPMLSEEEIEAIESGGASSVQI